MNDLGGMRALTAHWWVLLLRGLCAILFGVMGFAWPGLTIAVLVLIWGAYALVDGIFAVVAGVRSKWGSVILLGILGIAAGLITFFWPGITAITLVWIIAFWAIVAGVLQISAAIRLRKQVEGEWLWILSGLCMVILGVLLVARPGAGALSVMWLISCFADRVGHPAAHAGVQAEGDAGQALQGAQRAYGLEARPRGVPRRVPGSFVAPLPRGRGLACHPELKPKDPDSSLCSAPTCSLQTVHDEKVRGDARVAIDNLRAVARDADDFRSPGCRRDRRVRTSSRKLGLP